MDGIKRLLVVSHPLQRHGKQITGLRHILVVRILVEKHRKAATAGAWSLASTSA